MGSLIVRMAVVFGIGAALLMAAQRLWTTSVTARATSPAQQSVMPQAQLTAPIPGLEPENQHPVENLRPIGPPAVQPLDMSAAKRAAAESDMRRLDQMNLGRSVFPQPHGRMP